jgi:TolB-like protein
VAANAPRFRVDHRFIVMHSEPAGQQQGAAIPPTIHPFGHAPARTAPSPDEVRDQIDRIMASPALHASPRRRAFLRYVVDETLAGRADSLKGVSVAQAVFGRDSTFDQQADPVVRIEARRLRRDLDGYYVADGRHDPVRITIPKGGYSPLFEWQGPAADPPTVVGEPSRRYAGRIRIGAALAAGALLAAATVGAWLWFDRAQPGDQALGPSVIVLPFEPLGSSDDERYLAAGISEKLVDALRRFPGIRLYASPASADADRQSPIALGEDLGVAYVVAGTVRQDSVGVHVGAQLFDAATDRVLWTRTFDRAVEPAALVGVQRDLAADIASEIGQPYGVVSTDLTLRATSPDVANMQSYVCELRAYGYRRRLAQEEFAPVLDCLEQAVRRDPD